MVRGREWTGFEAAALQEAMRKSVRDFAGLLGVETTTISNWRTGLGSVRPRSNTQGILDTTYQQRATPDDRARFEQIVGEGEGVWRERHGAHRRLVPTNALAVQADRPATDSDSAFGVEPLSSALAATRDGEDALRLARWLLTNAVSSPPSAAPDGGDLARIALALSDAYRYFDGSVIEYFEQRLTLCKTEDGGRGSSAVLPMALAIVATIRRHCADAKPTVRQQLLSLGADGAEFVGWLYRDRRQPLVAGYWYDRAIEMAQEANDLSMQGYVLLRKSQMAYDDRDSLRVLTFAQAAAQGPWQLSAELRSEITQQEARGLAMTGESLDVVERALDSARQMLEAGGGTYENTHLLRSASTYVEAGKPAKAAALYRSVLDTDILSARDEGYFRARHAGALALCGEPDSAAEEGLRAIRRATETQSTRTKAELVRAVDALSRWQHRPGPSELRAAVAASAPTLG